MLLKTKQLSSPMGAALLPQLMSEVALPQKPADHLPIDSLIPALSEWNFYAPLPENKMRELIESIQQNGLLHPIVVWQQPNQPTMVLSGHNRLEAFRQLYHQTGEEQYKTIPCTIKKELTDEQAQEIVVDSNWVQRTLSPSEKAQSIRQKYILAGRKARSANGSTGPSTYDTIAQQYGLSGRQIARYIKLGSLQPELLQLLDNGKLTVATGVKLADYSPQQQKLLAPYIAKQGITTAQISTLNTEMSDSQLQQVFDPTPSITPKTVSVRVQIPVSLQEEFLQMAQRWITEKTANM